MKFINIVLFLPFVKKYISNKLGEALLKATINNLISFIFLLLGATIVFFAPGSKIAMFFFSLLAILILIRSTINIALTVIDFFNIVNFTSRISLKGTIYVIGNLIIILLPYLLFCGGYALCVNLILKPAVFSELANVSGFQLYSYFFLAAIDFIFKTNTLSWIGM